MKPDCPGHELLYRQLKATGQAGWDTEDVCHYQAVLAPQLKAGGVAPGMLVLERCDCINITALAPDDASRAGLLMG